MPERNNVYGDLTGDLDRVRDVLARAGYAASIKRSGHDGRLSLRIRANELELESEELASDHLLSGTVDPEQGEAILQKLSEVLARADISHRLELYAGEDEERCFEHP